MFGASAKAAGDGVLREQIRLSAGASPTGLLHVVGEDVVRAPLTVLKVKALLAVDLLLCRLRLEQLNRREETTRDFID